MVELFSRGGSSRTNRRSSSGTTSRRSFLSFGRRTDAPGKDVERFFPANNQHHHNIHPPPPVFEIDTMSHHTSSSFRGGRREVQREIVASRSSRLLMRQVSALGLEDPAHGESARNRKLNTPRLHPSHIFEDMDLNDLPPDMREEESIASDPTAVVIVDKSLLEMYRSSPDDSSTKQSSVGRPSDSSTKSHSKMSATGSTTPSTAPSRASQYFPPRSTCRMRASTGRSTATSRSNVNRSLIAEAAQAMMTSGFSCSDPIVLEAMGQSQSDIDRSQACNLTMDCGASSNRRQTFCSYVPQQSQDNDDGSRSRALPDFENIFPNQQAKQQLSPSRSVKSNLSRRSMGNIYEGDDYSAANSASNSAANSAARSMASAPWRGPAPWNDEAAPSIFFKSKSTSSVSSAHSLSPRRQPSSQRINTTLNEEETKEEDEEDDLEPEELEQLKNELAELEAALSFR